MGTRGDIYIRCRDNVVEMWRHWDAYPDYMVPYFKEFAKYASWCVGSQRHWLTYPEDVAAMLVAFDYEVRIADKVRFISSLREWKTMYEPRPDVRPRGSIDDFQKIWVIDLPHTEVADPKRIVWRIRGYDAFGLSGRLAKRMRSMLRKGKDLENDEFLKGRPLKEVDFTVILDHKDAERKCNMCGYPGPLLVTENPRLCIYCFLFAMAKDKCLHDEVRSALEVNMIASSLRGQ